MRVGFIGLGSQGAPMARRIVDAGYETTLWARRPATLVPFAGTPAKRAASPADLAAASDLVCVCVVDDAGLEEVLTGEHGVLTGLRRGGVVAVHSTVHPETCRRLADRARIHGVALVDAPVSGGGPAAARGRLVVMAGGEPGTVAYCRPVFATYANPVVHMGPLGTGQLAKLLNNVLFTANLATAADTLALGRDLAIDPAALAQVLAHGSAGSFALHRVTADGGTLDRFAGHAGPLLRKDVRLATEVAEASGARPDIVLPAASAALVMMNGQRPRLTSESDMTDPAPDESQPH
ncbi:NAD(P)-dependent oxidoreductase [Streptomyces sp. NBC_00365]|jgi:3-hydroxyisobutyrate dehydrogenase-like beta-hydroxyacid dehydrogenase|uniref:NAD(P)-dependent oxidoreductase n=1 Tax=Streptomyces sp. NBC_00365 TaxID=2975726 RepID=UPI00224E0DB7|nr:NAD(P)-dependent oxidoreductase [Streptomyces sp. NBC_00365]MCX5095685.1 NAD(P)-dependent oxidoreductase [Streptomyces sp. NBC_00365]